MQILPEYRELEGILRLYDLKVHSCYPYYCMEQEEIICTLHHPVIVP